MSSPTTPAASETRESHAHHFANLVMQQAGMTMIFLGLSPHPETGKTMFDLEGAQHFIAQLEMLEAKTRGNLDAEESALLKQSLTTVRMAFVQAVERGAPAGADKQAVAPTPADEPKLAPAPAAASEETAGAPAPEVSSDEARKKFVKKY